ncbi:hypothetical protein [Nonomuraea polychroma]|uniref:hypothetical protein n=1 Tax=Nonomuraea polychroma TaxID=46176 RepID=UPI000FDD0BCA|nr:hypothetical protein [Nonomuraea polychroma]
MSTLGEPGRGWTRSRSAPPPRVTPDGASNPEAIIKRHTEEVLFDRQTPEQAAKSFIRELQGEIDGA